MNPPIALPIDTIPPSFSIVSWNASSLLSRGPAVQLYLHHYRPSILVIIESRIHDTNTIPRHAAYNIMHIQHTHQHTHGGLVIYIHRSITCQQHNISCSFDPSTSSTVALLHVSSPQLKQPIMLIPSYISCTASDTDWNTYIRFIKRTPRHVNPHHTMPTIIIGDLNAKDPSWDPQHTQQHSNSAGASLSDFLSSHDGDDWHLLNITHQHGGSQPTRFSSIPYVHPSVIDLALCNDINTVNTFETLTSHHMLHSDHAPISITLDIIQPQQQQQQQQTLPTREVWNTSRENIPWDIFQALLSSTLQPWIQKWTPYLNHTITMTQQDIDTCWNELRDIITSIATRVIRKKAVSMHHKHWFTINPALPSLLRRYNQLKRIRDARRRDRIQISHELQQRYSQARTAFRVAVRDAKQECFSELVEQVSKDHRIIWKAWHRTIPSTRTPLPTFTSSHPADQPPMDDTENLNHIARYFQSISTIPQDPSFNNTQDDTVKQTVESLHLPSIPVTLPFTQQQLQEQCNNTNVNTMGGPDDISPHFLKHGGPALVSALFLIFHLCYQHGILPLQWTEGIICAFYKHTGDKHNVSNYRPINVTSIIIRTFDRLMLSTLLQHMSNNNIPYEHQYGFTKLRSTYDAIARFLDSISKQYHIPTPAVFIDISKAYDRVWVHGLIHKLHQLNMPPHVLFFYRALLSNRTFRVAGNGVMSDLYAIMDGVPQGGVSAPQLFTIYLHDIITAIHAALARIHAGLIYAININLFADDIVVWLSEVYAQYNKTPAATYLIMQAAMDGMTTWASTWKVTYSTTKTQMMLFRTDKCSQQLINTYTQHTLTLSGFNITTTNTYKYLGLFVHHTLSWTPHIRELIDKCTATSQQIARLASRKIHNRPAFHIIRQLVTSVLIPKITYALPFISLLPDTHKISRQLKRLIIYPLRRALGLPNNAHHDSIFVESRILPIRYLQQYHSILFARRYIKQATTQAQVQQRYDHMFNRQDNTPLYHPYSLISTRCKSIQTQHTTTLQAIQHATSKQLWNAVFNRFYTQWHQAQHPSAPDPDPHSLFPCYIHKPVYTDTSIRIPSYLHGRTLHPDTSSIVSRLRFNRARLNQSLHKRRCSITPMCTTCNTPETVEHVVMDCPRYDAIRFNCLCALSSITKQPPLRSSYPFPFLLCELPPSIPIAQHIMYIDIIAPFIHKLQRMRNM